MAKHRVMLALLGGAGFTALSLLLVKLLSPSGISLFLSLLLLPGGTIVRLGSGSQDISPPLLVFAVNAVVYAAIAFIGLTIFGPRIAVEKMRLATIRLAFPAGILVGLACIPAINPLWPRGMTELTKQEKVLRDAFPVGMGMGGARAILRSKGIQFQEETETSKAVVVTRPYGSVTAAAGDRVISARIETHASQFPCGYDIEVVLLFGPDERMKDQYVHRLRLCP